MEPIHTSCAVVFFLVWQSQLNPVHYGAVTPADLPFTSLEFYKTIMERLQGLLCHILGYVTKPFLKTKFEKQDNIVLRP